MGQFVRMYLYYIEIDFFLLEVHFLIKVKTYLSVDSLLHTLSIEKIVQIVRILDANPLFFNKKIII
jgi:hypothetical protein